MSNEIESKEEEKSSRLSEDIRVVESIKQLLLSKSWSSFVGSYVIPSIKKLHLQLENAARNTTGEEYLRKFYATQGELKILERLENLEAFAERYDDEIKGLKKQLQHAKDKR